VIYYYIGHDLYYSAKSKNVPRKGDFVHIEREKYYVTAITLCYSAGDEWWKIQLDVEHEDVSGR